MIRQIIEAWCAENSIYVSGEQLDAFEKYASLLCQWNEKMNLTAITDDEGIAVKHFVDSISVLTAADIKGSVIDIGTGAGFPGIPLKIMHPEIELTLLDSLNKRLLFLDEVLNALGLSADTVHARAEDGSQRPEMREQFDIAVSRAVANLPALCEYCLPYVKVGGIFISMKGPDGANEIAAAENAIKLLGGDEPETKELTLPDGSRRTIIIIKKSAHTPSKYPRKKTKISKNPL